MSGGNEVLWSWGPGESRLALVSDDRPDLVTGAIFLGRVIEFVPALNAAFVDIGTNRPGFLPHAAELSQGQALLVQVRADAYANKGTTLTTDLSNHSADWAEIQNRQQSSQTPALLWRPNPLARLLANNPQVEQVLVDDAATHATARRSFGDMVKLCHDTSVAASLDDAVAAALDPVVKLPSGGRIIIETMSTLTAIDVDSGPSRPPDANREAIPAIARELRLRSIGGQIVVDFIRGGSKNTPMKLAADMKKAVAEDSTPTHVFGTGPLGMLEMTRERRGPSFAELMTECGQSLSPAAAAHTALRRAIAESPHRHGRALCLVLAPELATYLTAHPPLVNEAEDRMGRKLTIRSDASHRREDIGIEDHTG